MMNWKGFGKKQSWLNFKVLSQHLPQGTEENHKEKSQNSWSPGWDLYLRHPEYETGVLTTQPQRSVMLCIVKFHLPGVTEKAMKNL
jgi:hypothetical protein